MTKPMAMARPAVQNRFANGKASAKGATPRNDTQITALRPMRSPTGPPAKVPAATAARKMNRKIWLSCTLNWKRSIR